MLEIVNQLDGFDSRGNIKVLMATNRPDTLDPALLRPGRLDRKVEVSSSCASQRLPIHASRRIAAACMASQHPVLVLVSTVLARLSIVTLAVFAAGSRV